MNLDLLKKSFDHAVMVHGTDLKKATSNLMIYHPMAVASLVLQYGGTEKDAAVALLHDTLGSQSFVKMKELYGEDVAAGVYAFSDPDLSEEEELFFDGATEDEKWLLLKRNYLKKVSGLGSSQCLVIFCEELHDGRELVHDLKHYGPMRALKRYPLSAQLALKHLNWYYDELSQILQRTDLSQALKSEFQAVLGALKSWA